MSWSKATARFGRLVLLVACAVTLCVRTGGAAAPKHNWPKMADIIAFENLEGVILLRAQLRGEASRDTEGLVALDTGAGYLALDHELAIQIGLIDGAPLEGAIELTTRPLPRLKVGSVQWEQVTPVLTFDGGIVRQVTDRPVLGLLGEKLFASRALGIDYLTRTVALIPLPDPADATARAASGHDPSARVKRGRSNPDSSADAAQVRRSRAALGDVLGKRAIAVPFELAGDGKVLVHGRVSNPQPPRFSDRLALIVDTGATKCVLFEEAMDEKVSGAKKWPTLKGLSAPTLFGAAPAHLARIPLVEISKSSIPLRVRDVDAAVIRSELSGTLSRVVGEPVHGLLGYSFLKRFRIIFDYPNRTLWLEPLGKGWNDRPFEYSHVGVQLERREGSLAVVGVASTSPADVSGIRPGDEVVAVNGLPVSKEDVISLTRRLEGPPGTSVRLTIRRGNTERTYRLIRRRLL